MSYTLESLGTEPESVLLGREDLLAVLAHADDVRGHEPDLVRLATLDARDVIVTAMSDLPEYDLVSRFFGPRAGIPEDPVTGSAHCTLVPYRGNRLGKSSLRGFQVSVRGGVVGVRLMQERIQLEGRAVTTLRGSLYV